MGSWSYGLFGCFNNCCICIKSYFLPCVMYGQVAGSVGKSCCCHTLFFFIPICNWVVMTNTRGKMRDQLDIPGTCCGDALLTVFCIWCTLAQEGNEMAVQSATSMDRE